MAKQRLSSRSWLTEVSGLRIHSNLIKLTFVVNVGKRQVFCKWTEVNKKYYKKTSNRRKYSTPPCAYDITIIVEQIYVDKNAMLEKAFY